MLFFSILSKKFSTPTNRNQNVYYATQYLSEYLKHQGYDGIRFNSSLNSEGNNVILFDISVDWRKYEIRSSELYKVDNIEVQFTPLEFNEKEK